MIKNHYNIKDEFGRRKLPTRRLCKKTESVTFLGTQTEIARNDSDWARKKCQTNAAARQRFPTSLGRRQTFPAKTSGDVRLSDEVRSNDFDCKT